MATALTRILGFSRLGRWRLLPNQNAMKTQLRRRCAAIAIAGCLWASAAAAFDEPNDKKHPVLSDRVFSVLLINGETKTLRLGAFDFRTLTVAPPVSNELAQSIPTSSVLAVRQTPPRSEMDNFARNAKRLGYQTLTLDDGQVVFARSIRVDFKAQTIIAEPLFDNELSLTFRLSQAISIRRTESATPAPSSGQPSAEKASGQDFSLDDDVILLNDGRLIACELVALSSAGDVRYKSGQTEASVPYNNIASVQFMRVPDRASSRPAKSSTARTPAGTVRVRFIDSTELNMTLPPPAESGAAELTSAVVRLLNNRQTLSVRWTAILSVAHTGAAVQSLTELEPVRVDFRPAVAADGLPSLFEPRVNRSLFGREYPNRSDAIAGGVAFASLSDTMIRADALYETISMRSTTTMTWAIPETAISFVADALIEPDVAADGEAVCELLLDYRPVETATLTQGGRGRRFLVNVQGRRFLSLAVRRGTDGNETDDHIVWRFPRFILSAESRR